MKHLIIFGSANSHAGIVGHFLLGRQGTGAARVTVPFLDDDGLGVADVFVTNVVLKHITIALQLRFYLWTDMAKLLRVLHVQLRAFLIVIYFSQQFIGIATEDDSK